MGTAYLPRRLTKSAIDFEKLVPTSKYMFFLDAKQRSWSSVLSGEVKPRCLKTKEAFLKVRAKALDLAHGWHIINTGQSIDRHIVLLRKY